MCFPCFPMFSLCFPCFPLFSHVFSMFSNVFFCILAFLPCASWTLRADVAACSCAATACARRGWSWALRVLEASHHPQIFRFAPGYNRFQYAHHSFSWSVRPRVRTKSNSQ
jgi:hypothetical protein